MTVLVKMESQAGVSVNVNVSGEAWNGLLREEGWGRRSEQSAILNNGCQASVVMDVGAERPDGREG